MTVNARVSGQAVEIAVHDNERVRQGQVLFRIDPEPYQIAVDQAEAHLGSARLQIESLKATYHQQQAELQSAKDSAAFDEREYDRKKVLVAYDFTPRQVYERAETDSRSPAIGRPRSNSRSPTRSSRSTVIPISTSTAIRRFARQGRNSTVRGSISPTPPSRRRTMGS